MFKKRFSMMTVLVACLCAIVVTLGKFEISQDVSFGPGKICRTAK